MSPRSYKPSEAAAVLAVSVETALDMIHRKQLAAFSVSPPGSKRPRYRIPEDALESFMRGSSALPAPQSSRRKQKQKPRIKFYT